MPNQSPNTPVLTLPAVRAVYQHCESLAYYRVIRTGREVTYERIGDRRRFTLVLTLFNIRLRPVTLAQANAVATAEPFLTSQRLPATVINVENILLSIGNGSLGQSLANEPHSELPPEPPASDSPFMASPEMDTETEVGLLVEPGEYDTFENLIVYPDTLAEIMTAVRSISIRPDLERVFQLGRIQPNARCIINMYGVPGVGKTKCAKAVAKKLGKKLYVVDYAQVISKYMGDTAKHIRQAFKRAHDHQAILLFDEADSLVSKRLSMDRDCATSVNQNRNTLMQELDRFSGIVLMSTNMFSNYDDALLRRINRHVEFKLPDADMLEALYKLHIPALERVRDVDFSVVAKASAGFSGGDVLNVCVNAMEAAAMRDENPENWYVTEDLLVDQIQRVASSKKAHVVVAKKKGPTWLEKFVVKQFGGKLPPHEESDGDESVETPDSLRGEGTCGVSA